MFWRRNIPGEGDRERLLLAYQIAIDIGKGRFPINKELALELSALMSQVRKRKLTIISTKYLIFESYEIISSNILQIFRSILVIYHLTLKRRPRVQSQQ